MNEITVELLSFRSCPLAPAMLSQLEQAVLQLEGHINVKIIQIDLMHPDIPESLTRWGSPTILLNGMDISGARQSDANCCRIYSGANGVLSRQEIAAILLESVE